MKKVAIDIELIRDWYSTLVTYYVKFIDDWEGNIDGVKPSDLWQHFKFPKYIEKINDTDDNGEKYVDFVETSLEVDEKSPYEVNQTYFNDFLNKHVLEIFGGAINREKNIMTFLNGKSREFDITLFTNVKGKAKPATYFYLSKSGCEINKVIFVNEKKDIENHGPWDRVLYAEYSSTKNLKLKDMDFKNI